MSTILKLNRKQKNSSGIQAMELPDMSFKITIITVLKELKKFRFECGTSSYKKNKM